MDCRTGEVMDLQEVLRRVDPNGGNAIVPEDMAARVEQLRELGGEGQFYKPVPYQRLKTKTGRNDPCPCMSGRKFKKCCLMTVG